MAIAKGQQSFDATPRALYQGVAAVKVLAVNPTKAELEKIYGREFDKDPVYLSEAEVDGKKYPSVRITFICQTDPEKNNGIDAIFQHTFFLQKRYRFGSTSQKFQVIDCYGRTAWGTKEEIQAKSIPLNKDGRPANVDADYRPAYVSEEYLTNFIRNLLNIPNVSSYVNGEWIDNPKIADKKDCLVRLDEIDKYFTGDFKELKEIISYQPGNLVKIGVGVKTKDGRTHQVTFDRVSFKNAATDYARLDAEVQQSKSMGGLADTEFDFQELHEYTVTPTDTATLEAAAAATAATNDADPWA